MLKCYCTLDVLEHCESERDENGREFCKNATYCYVARDFLDGKLVTTHGCREKLEHCYVRRPDHAVVTECCSSGDFCNDETMFQQLNERFPWVNTSLAQSDVTSAGMMPPPNYYALYASAALFALFLFLLAMLICKITRSGKSASGFSSSICRDRVTRTGQPLLTANRSFPASFQTKSRTACRLACYWWRCLFSGSWFRRKSHPMNEVYYQRPVSNPNTAISDDRYSYVESTTLASTSHELIRHQRHGSRLSATNDLTEPSSSVLPTQQTYVDFSHLASTCDVSISGSGSGRGVPLLVPQTVARSVQLIEVIGRGRYGEVWRGELNGEQVAVKIFASRDEPSWHREAFIFNQTRLRHDNIVNFLAADVFGRGSTTELWLIISYHKHGSLFDYLMKNCINLKTMLRFAASSARGLHYLHSSIGPKPAMAHRDIKSKNLLVKDDLTLCIADLGLVAIEGQEIWKPQFGTSDNKVGTRRYMAPELLAMPPSDSVSFIGLIRADIYSFALVLWELISRSDLHSFSNYSSQAKICDYQPPYYGMLSSDPSVEDMCELVIKQNARPLLPVNLDELKAEALPNCREVAAILERYWNATCECWDGCPENRPPTLLLKKTIYKVENDFLELWKNTTLDDTNPDLNTI